MKLNLRMFALAGDWSPLLSDLPGWEMDRAGAWSDGQSTILPSAPYEVQPRIGFLVSTSAHWRALSERVRNLPGRVVCGLNTIDLTAPSGVSLRFHRIMPLQDDPRRRDFLLNHLAVNVEDLAGEHQFYEHLLGPSTVLVRAEAWEPVQGVMRPDVHLFRRPEFYITLRGGFDRDHVDHIGWMAAQRRHIDVAAGILTRIGWPIVLGPLTIDGSYLVHFRGPDGKVHDFFHPEERLSAELPPAVSA